MAKTEARILVVDDDPDILVTARMLLKRKEKEKRSDSSKLSVPLDQPPLSLPVWPRKGV